MTSNMQKDIQPLGYLVGYFDVLGFENHFNKLRLEGMLTRYEALIRKVNNKNQHFENIQKILNLDAEPFWATDDVITFYPVRGAYASDSIVLWADCTWKCARNKSAEELEELRKNPNFGWMGYPVPCDSFLDICNELLCHSLEIGLPLRGAISSGEAYIDEDRRIFLGTPMVDAARLERNQRIIGATPCKSFHTQTIPKRYLLPFQTHLKDKAIDMCDGMVLDWPRHWRKTRNNPLEAIVRVMSDSNHKDIYENTLEMIWLSSSYSNQYESLPETSIRLAYPQFADPNVALAVKLKKNEPEQVQKIDDSANEEVGNNGTGTIWRGGLSEEQIQLIADDAKHAGDVTFYMQGELAPTTTQDQPSKKLKTEEAYKRALDLDPANHLLWNNKGYFLAHILGHYDEAEQAFRNAIDLHPTEATPWNNLAKLLAGPLRRFEEAEAAFRKAIELDPSDTHLWNNLGNLLADNLNDLVQSESSFRKAIELNPLNARAWNNLGNLFGFSLGRFEEAELAYRKAIDIDPSSAHRWHNLGNLLAFALNRYSEAETIFRKAIELDPQLIDAWNGLGALMAGPLQEFEEAETIFRKTIELNPMDAHSWNNLGCLLSKLTDRHKEAETAFRKAIELQPTFILPQNNLDRLLTQFGKENYGNPRGR